MKRDNFPASLSRVELVSDREGDDSFLYSEIKGRYGEQGPDTLSPQQFGFASRPPAGSVGLRHTQGGQHSTPFVSAMEHPAHRPKLDGGASALYDANGNIIKLFADGVAMDFQTRTVTMTAGEWNLKGNFTVDGALHVTGNITTDSTNPNNHSH